MKKLIMTIAVLVAAYSHGATYRQASQGWVEMKLAQLETRILANVSAASSATNAAQAEAIINNSTDVAISGGYDIANTMLTTSVGVKTEGVPYYIIGMTSMPLVFPSGTTLWQASENSYTNAGATITLYEYPLPEGNFIRRGLTNVLKLKDDGVLYYGDEDFQYAVIMKCYK